MKNTGNDEQGPEYYDGVYRRVFQRVVPREHFVAEHIRALQSTNQLDKVSILDVGCGCGTFIEVLEKGWDYRGFDFSTVAVEMAQKKFPDGNLQVANVYDSQSYLPVDYNVIVCGQVLEHTDDLKVLEIFPKNVHIIVTVPTFGDPAHIRYYESTQDVSDRFAESLDIQYIQDIGGGQIMFRGIKR